MDENSSRRPQVLKSRIDWSNQHGSEPATLESGSEFQIMWGGNRKSSAADAMIESLLDRELRTNCTLFILFNLLIAKYWFTCVNHHDLYNYTNTSSGQAIQHLN